MGPEANLVKLAVVIWGKTKSVKNLKQFRWWHSHKNTKSLPTMIDAKLEQDSIRDKASCLEWVIDLLKTGKTYAPT